MIPKLRIARPTNDLAALRAFYIEGEPAEWEAAVARLRARGYVPVPAHNPY